MTTSPILGLPFLDSQQAAPEVTHNEALLLITALLMGAGGSSNAPPGAPSDGDVWIVGTAGSGAFNGHSNAIAIRFGGEWRFVPGYDDAGSVIPMGAEHEGLRVWRSDLDCMVVWDGAAWVAAGSSMRSATVATAGAATGPTRWQFISDESGGAVPAFNDGVDWRRATDRAVIS